MKTKMLQNMMIVVLLVLMGATQATAVEYKNQYKVQSTKYKVQIVNNQSSAVSIQTSAPSATFQSTSAYSGQWNQDAQQSTLNSDGTVNAEAYGVGRSSVGGRRSGSGSSVNPGTPDDDEDDEEEQQPIGDGLWILMVLAGAYAGVRAFIRNRALKG